MKNQHIHAEMADELAMAEVLAGFEPVNPENKELISLLTKWTKYERPEGYATMARLGEGIQLCMIVNPATQGVALIIRTFEDALVKITADDRLAQGHAGIIRAATPEDEPLVGWIDYNALDGAAKKAIDSSGRKPWNKYAIDGMRVLARHSRDDDAATISTRQEMALAQGEQIIKQARRAYEFQIARDTEGFGGAAIEPERVEDLDDLGAGF